MHKINKVKYVGINRKALEEYIDGLMQKYVLIQGFHNIQSKMNYAFKPYKNYLTNRCNDMFHVTPCEKTEVL